MVRQVFVSERVLVDTDGDGNPDVERTRIQMAFGDHPDIPAEDDPRDGVSNAVPLGNKIRIVMDELLDGSTLEQIGCAGCVQKICEPCEVDGDCTGTNTCTDGFCGSFRCEAGEACVDGVCGPPCVSTADCGAPNVCFNGVCSDCYSDIPSGTTPDDVADCSGVDLRDCTAVCTHINSATNQPTGILDENEDGAPDLLRFKEGIVHLVCGDVEMPLDLDSVSKTFWNPSGNQQIPAGDIGIGGLGPAIVVVAPMFRTSSTCTIEIDPSVVDKDGHPVCAPEGGDITNDCPGGEDGNDTSLIEFDTQTLKLLGSSPADEQDLVPGTISMLMQFNAFVSSDSIDPDGDGTPDNVTLSPPGLLGPATIATEAGDAAIISISVECALAPATEYTIHAESGDNGLLDLYGAPLAEDIDITFMTADPFDLGVSCACDGQCESGFCIDGVCCNTRCGDSDANDCQECDVSGGTCDEDADCSSPTVCVDDVSGDPCGVDADCSCGEPGTCTISPDTQVCRPPHLDPALDLDCDAAETCDGVLAACPADVLAPVDTACNDGVAEPICNPDVCDGAGVCTDNALAPDDTVCGAELICNPGVCTAGGCGDNVAAAEDTACGEAIAEPTCNPDACDAAGVCVDVSALADESVCAEVSSGDCCIGICTDTSGTGDLCP